jgi:hypothetical protein
MSNKTWKIEVEGQQHVIEVQTGSFAGGGSVTVDGKVANKWGSSISGLPVPLKFEIQGKKAEIKSKGFMANTPALYLDGKEIK